MLVIALIVSVGFCYGWDRYEKKQQLMSLSRGFWADPQGNFEK